MKWIALCLLLAGCTSPSLVQSEPEAPTPGFDMSGMPDGVAWKWIQFEPASDTWTFLGNQGEAVVQHVYAGNKVTTSSIGGDAYQNIQPVSLPNPILIPANFTGQVDSYHAQFDAATKETRWFARGADGTFMFHQDWLEVDPDRGMLPSTQSDAYSTSPVSVQMGGVLDVSKQAHSMQVSFASTYPGAATLSLRTTSGEAYDMNLDANTPNAALHVADLGGEPVQWSITPSVPGWYTFGYCIEGTTAC